MVEEKYIELINKEIDGLISEKEKHQLHEYLNNNPDAKMLYEETKATNDLVNQVSDIAPSPNLKKRILNLIDKNRYTVENLQKTERSSIAEWFKSLNPGYGYSFATGVVIGLIIFSVFLAEVIEKDKLENINFYGTIGIPESTNVQQFDRVSLNLLEVSGTVSSFKFDNIVWFDVNITTSDRCEMTFLFDQTKITFSSFKPLDHLNTLFGNEKDKIHISINGNSHFLLLFTQKFTENAQINLKIDYSAQAPFTYIFKIQSEDK